MKYIIVLLLFSMCSFADYICPSTVECHNGNCDAGNPYFEQKYRSRVPDHEYKFIYAEHYFAQPDYDPARCYYNYSGSIVILYSTLNLIPANSGDWQFIGFNLSRCINNDPVRCPFQKYQKV